MENNSQSGNNKTVTYILIALLAVSLIFNIVQYNKGVETVTVYEQKVDTLRVANQELTADLDFTSTELNKFKGISDSLDAVVNEKQNELSKMEEQIKSLKSAAKKDASKKKELEKLLADYKKKLDESLEQIDQLITENNMLKEQNANLTSTVSNLNEEKTNLQGRVKAGSVIKSEYVTVKAYKKRFNDKYAETSLAKKAEKLNVCFTVLDNSIAESGEKTAYLRLIGPDNKVVADKTKGSGTLDLVDNPDKSMYTISVPFKYNKSKQNICVDYVNGQSPLAEGAYTVEIYIDNALSSTSKFVLK